MTDLMRQITELTTERGKLFAKLQWSDADRAKLSELNNDIELLYRQRRAELAKAPQGEVPLGTFAVDRAGTWRSKFGRDRQR